MLHVLGRLIALEPAQADLLQRICAGPMLAVDALRAAIDAAKPPNAGRRKSAKARDSRQMKLLD